MLSFNVLIQSNLQKGSYKLNLCAKNNQRNRFCRWSPFPPFPSLPSLPSLQFPSFPPYPINIVVENIFIIGSYANMPTTKISITENNNPLNSLIQQYIYSSKSQYVHGELCRFRDDLNKVDATLQCCIQASLQSYCTQVNNNILNHTHYTHFNIW